eukprot:14043858-Alexandrium_andersonii.AAC.1
MGPSMQGRRVRAWWWAGHHRWHVGRVTTCVRQAGHHATGGVYDLLLSGRRADLPGLWEDITNILRGGPSPLPGPGWIG